MFKCPFKDQLNLKAKYYENEFILQIKSSCYQFKIVDNKKIK